MKKIALAGVALAALAALPAAAQSGPDDRARAGEPVTRAEVQSRVQARFAKADGDRNGFVTREEAAARRGEVREGVRARRGERREALFARLDSNRDGVLSHEEFDAPRAGPGKGARHGPRAQRFGRGMDRRGGGGMNGGFGGRGFAALDADGDGRVSLQEAQARALQLFDRVDSNRDGTITPDERRAVREAFRARRRG
jgi:Ca2+-binding EF-hand superfamily protein